MVKGNLVCGQGTVTPPTVRAILADELSSSTLFLSGIHIELPELIFTSIGISGMKQNERSHRTPACYLLVNVSSAPSLSLTPAHTQYAEPAFT